MNNVIDNSDKPDSNIHYYNEDRLDPANYVFKVNALDVGKFYYPVDNSHAWNKTDNTYSCGLAGGSRTPRTLVMIASAPYNEIVNFIGNTYLNTFVDVFYNGCIHKVLNYFSNFIVSPFNELDNKPIIYWNEFMK